jgi:antitoxin (DNA-binding transcriptional repressor) of toxin-antitoxin stability system
VGSATLRVRGEIQFNGGAVKIDDVSSGDVGVASLAANAVGTPLTYALAGGFEALKLTGISLDISSVEERRQMQITSITGPRYARPGEQIELGVHLAGFDGAEAVRKIQYRVPVGAREQAYNFTVSDAAQANSIEMQALSGVALRSPEQVLGVLNRRRPNTNMYLRVVRAGESYQVAGREMPSPPPSVAMILGRAQPGSENTVTLRGAAVAEIEIPGGESLITGSKTIQIEVKP